MNYYIFYCGGDGVRDYLGDTNYVGVWANNLSEAIIMCYDYMNISFLMHVMGKPKDVTIGYLY
jgi:hypothetical protein